MRKMIVMALVVVLASMASAGFYGSDVSPDDFDQIADAPVGVMAAPPSNDLVMIIDGQAVADGADVLPGDFGLEAVLPILRYDLTITFAQGLTFTNPTSFPVDFTFPSKLVSDPSLAANQIRITGSQWLEDPIAGVLFEGIALGGRGTVNIYDNMAVSDFGSFNVVPEPMTLAFLGLGGLLIRRKNRKEN